MFRTLAVSIEPPPQATTYRILYKHRLSPYQLLQVPLRTRVSNLRSTMELHLRGVQRVVPAEHTHHLRRVRSKTVAKARLAQATHHRLAMMQGCLAPLRPFETGKAAMFPIIHQSWTNTFGTG
jgi:hypothetical protein